MSGRLFDEEAVRGHLRRRGGESYLDTENSSDRVKVPTLDRRSQRRRKPVRLTVGVIPSGVLRSGLMRGEMAVNDRTVMRVASAAGVQMLGWEHEQSGHRKRQQAAQERTALPRQLHPGIMTGTQGTVKHPTQADQFCASNTRISASFSPTPLVFGASIFILGVLCALTWSDRSAYRFAGVTLTAVLLIPRPNPAWQVAVHRFAEVSIGIAVALLLAVAWPERESTPPAKA